MRPLRIAFVTSSDSTFIQRDRDILREFALVTDVRWMGLQSIPRLAWAVARSDVTFSWFALDHAYGACRLARMLGRKSIVVVGGVDAAKAPELGYGAYLDPRVAARSRYALTYSDRVLIVDESLRGEIARNAGVQRPEIVTLPLGFDTDFFSPGEAPRSTVLTVGYATDSNLRRKGLETFVAAARLLPELPFVLVGVSSGPASDRLRALAPPNVRFAPSLAVPELREEYRRARVYVQVSRYEGFPSALGEAMSCGCVPVGTRVGGIPTLIGDTGYYVEVDDIQGTAAAIQEAYESGNGDKARSRIVQNFPLERRRRALRELVEEVVAAQGALD